MTTREAEDGGAAGLAARLEMLAAAERVAGMGSWTRDLVSGELRWSDGLYRLLGLAPGTPAPDYGRYLAAIHPEDRAIEVAARARGLKEGRYEARLRLIAADGTLRHVINRGECVHGEDGRPLRLVGTVQDVTGLRQSEARFRAVVEGSLQGVLVHRDFRPLFANRALAGLFGRTPEEVLALPSILELFAPEERERMRGYGVARMAGGSPPTHYQVRGQRRDGTACWLECRIIVVDWNDAPAIQTTMIDITQRKQAEDALRHNEALLSLVAGNLPGFITYIGRDLRYRFINRMIADWHGAEPDEIVGRRVDEVLGPERFAALRPHIERTLAGEEQVFQHAVDGPDGMHMVRQHLVPYRDAEGRVDGLVALGQDVTGLYRAEQALREREAQLRLITDALPALISYLDPALRFRFVNRTGLAWYARPAERIVGHHVSEVIGAAAFAENGTIYQAACRGVPQSLQLPRTFGDGITREVEARLVPHFGEDGRLLGIVVLALDVTERHRLEAQLRQSQKMEAVGQLTGGVAHEFNNLLQVIQGNLELLQEEGPPDMAASKSVRAALVSTRRAAELTSRLLAFSRQQPLAPQAVALAPLLHETREMLDPTLGDRVRLTVDLPDAPWPVQVDPGQLQNAVVNLCLNARDALPEGGRIRISATDLTLPGGGIDGAPAGLAAGDYVVLSVADTGAGMPAEVAARAFEPFYTTKPKGKGTGLGLSMVYGFASQSGGGAAIDSTPGRGTAVHLYLPRARLADASAA